MENKYVKILLIIFILVCSCISIIAFIMNFIKCQKDSLTKYNYDENIQHKKIYFNLIEKIPIKDRNLLDSRINYTVIKAPTNFLGIIKYVEKIHKNIARIKSDYFVYQYGNNPPFVLKRKKIGEGQQGIVYEIINTKDPRVIKFPKANWHSLTTIIDEYMVYDFWKNIPKSKFGIPDQISYNKLGLYRVTSKNIGETLTKAMVRRGILTFNTKTLSNSSTGKNILKSERSNFKKIRDSIMEMIKVSVENPDICPSLSPNNIHVTYSTTNPNKIEKIDLLDIGIVHHFLSKYKKIDNFDKYLSDAEDRLDKYLKEPEYSYDLSSILDAQKEYENRKMQNII